MTLRQTADGIVRYLDAEVFPRLSPMREIAARIAVARMTGDEALNALAASPLLKTFAVLDKDGNVDVDGLCRDIKAQIERKGQLTIDIPLIGSFAFVGSDVDTLKSYIGGAR